MERSVDSRKTTRQAGVPSTTRRTEVNASGCQATPFGIPSDWQIKHESES
jgi:hypothetical protein